MLQSRFRSSDGWATGAAEPAREGPDPQFQEQTVSEIHIPRRDLMKGHLPRLCLKTGEPVETLDHVALAPSRIPALTGLPTGLVPRDLLARALGEAIEARIPRSEKVRQQQLAVFAVRVLVTVVLAIRTLLAVASANLVGAGVSLLLIGVLSLGLAWVNRKVSVGAVLDDTDLVIYDPHPDFAAAMQEMMTEDYVPAERPRPKVAPGIY